MTLSLVRQPHINPAGFVKEGNFSAVVTQVNKQRIECVFPHGETVTEILEGDLVAVISEMSEDAIRGFLIGFLGLPDSVEIKFE